MTKKQYVVILYNSEHYEDVGFSPKHKCLWARRKGNEMPQQWLFEKKSFTHKLTGCSNKYVKIICLDEEWWW